jgi:MYXO-CTERM domain-containing protein
MRFFFFLLGLFMAGGALAEPDTFGLGTGRSGSLRNVTQVVSVPEYTDLEIRRRASAEMLRASSPMTGPRRFAVVSAAPDGGGGGRDPKPDGGGGGPGGAERPLLEVPMEGEVVDPTPLISGTSAIGTSVSIEVDDTEVARVSLDAQGRFQYELTLEQALVPGVHRVSARAWDAEGKEGPPSQKTNFEVGPPPSFEVGCGCGTSPGAGLGAMAVVLGLWAARRRQRG